MGRARCSARGRLKKASDRSARAATGGDDPLGVMRASTPPAGGGGHFRCQTPRKRHYVARDGWNEGYSAPEAEGASCPSFDRSHAGWSPEDTGSRPGGIRPVRGCFRAVQKILSRTAPPRPAYLHRCPVRSCGWASEGRHRASATAEKRQGCGMNICHLRYTWSRCYVRFFFCNFALEDLHNVSARVCEGGLKAGLIRAMDARRLVDSPLPSQSSTYPWLWAGDLLT